MLFDTLDRQMDHGKRPDQGDFEYLNLSGRPEAARVRDFIEACLRSYPAEHRPEIVARLKASDLQFASATFELFLNRLFSLLNWTVTVHPELPNGSPKRPDFLVHTPEGGAFYLEATLVRQFSEQEQAVERRKNEVIRAIDDIPSPDFLLDVYLSGSPRSTVPRRNLRRGLRRWIASLDYDIAFEQYRNRERLPEYDYEHDGWKIRFKPIPRGPERRGSGRRAIGAFGGGVRPVKVLPGIRDAAKSKGGRYGELDLPLIVAINVEDRQVDTSVERDALFGQLELVFDREDPNAEHRARRCRDGVWFGPHGPQYTRLSGVWMFRRFDVWHFVSRSSHLLYLNPDALHPLGEETYVLPHAIVEQGKLSERDGLSFEVFDLPESWPEDATDGGERG